MNVLDENVTVIQRQLLRSWRIPTRHIGYDAGRKGMTDEEIIPFLLSLRRPTFFTFDWDFYTSDLCHARYCLVYLDVSREECAHLFAVCWPILSLIPKRSAWGQSSVSHTLDPSSGGRMQQRNYFSTGRENASCMPFPRLKRT